MGGVVVSVKIYKEGEGLGGAGVGGPKLERLILVKERNKVSFVNLTEFDVVSH